MHCREATAVFLILLVSHMLAGNGVYEKQLRANNALDFDDLLVKAVQLFQTQPDVLEYYQERFVILWWTSIRIRTRCSSV